MAKAIKHIRAGLLHVEVLGSVPEGTRRRRAARSGTTPPAQAFYNLKHSWQECELTMATNFGRRDLVLTFTFDDAHLPECKDDAGKLFRRFVRRLRGIRKKRGQELKYIYVVEGFHAKSGNGPFDGDGALEDKRYHIHAVLNATGPGDLEEIRSLWQFGGYIRAEPLDVHYYRELAKYLTKEAREWGRPTPGERTWRGSRNLAKYEVEYIEIPTDSVTLAPPAGAVDYQPFSETNPYGYGASIGARYLLFPKDGKPDLSYTRGRKSNNLNNFQT